MKRARIPLVALLLVSLAGCAVPRSGTLGSAPTGSPPPVRATAVPLATTETTPAGTVTVQLWFVRDGRLVPTRRTRPATVTTSRLTLTELVAGPTEVERSAGYTTGITGDFEIVSIVDGVEKVQLPATFYAGDAAAVRLRRAQVVYSLTQFPSVSAVDFRDTGGDRIGAVEGRTDHADLLPPIAVTAPTIGQAVGSPIIVAGTAEVFEATVAVRVLDASGREIATAFTVATCGTGCRGDFRVTLPYTVPADQPGTVEVFQVSPRDGARTDLVAVPVTLTRP